MTTTPVTTNTTLVALSDPQSAAAEAFRSLEARLPEARTRFKGETWDSSWTQWDRQIEAFRAKLATRS